MTGRFTLGKAERLSHRKQIDSLFTEGFQFNLFPYRVFYKVAEAPAMAPVQVLFAIPKKKFRRAVARNRIRRVTREAYRLHKYELVDTLASKSLNLHIGFVYIGSTAEICLADVEEKLRCCLKKLAGLV